MKKSIIVLFAIFLIGVSSCYNRTESDMNCYSLNTEVSDVEEMEQKERNVSIVYPVYSSILYTVSYCSIQPL